MLDCEHQALDEPSGRPRSSVPFEKHPKNPTHPIPAPSRFNESYSISNQQLSSSAPYGLKLIRSARVTPFSVTRDSVYTVPSLPTAIEFTYAGRSPFGR